MVCTSSLLDQIPFKTFQLCTNLSQDLESRKRAPLYQKKQEEELRAFTEKAAEAETRATHAEGKAKDACAELETAQQCLADAGVAAERAAKAAASAAGLAAEQHQLELARLALEAAKAQVCI